MDQYVAQYARGSFIATIYELETAFGLSFPAQIVNQKEKVAKAFNKRRQWHIDLPPGVSILYNSISSS